MLETKYMWISLFIADFRLQKMQLLCMTGLFPDNGATAQTSNTIPIGAFYMPFVADAAATSVAVNEPYLRRAPLRCHACNAVANKFCVVTAGLMHSNCCCLPRSFIHSRCCARQHAFTGSWSCAICSTSNDLAELLSPGVSNHCRRVWVSVVRLLDRY